MRIKTEEDIRMEKMIADYLKKNKASGGYDKTPINKVHILSGNGLGNITQEQGK